MGSRLQRGVGAKTMSTRATKMKKSPRLKASCVLTQVSDVMIWFRQYFCGKYSNVAEIVCLLDLDEFCIKNKNCVIYKAVCFEELEVLVVVLFCSGSGIFWFCQCISKLVDGCFCCCCC